MSSNIKMLITLHNPNYLFCDANRAVLNMLDDFIDDVIAGKSPRLVITMPPRSGKSSLVSHYLPACTSLKGLKSSNTTTSDIVSKNNVKRCNKIIEELFGFLSDQDKRYSVSEPGKSLSIGNFDIGIIDDPVKSMIDANDASYTSNFLEWFEGDFRDSVTDTGGIVAFMSRWNEDDLASKLMDSMSKDANYRFLNLPAIIENKALTDLILSPFGYSRFSLISLLAIKDAIGNEAWNALYQGVPAQTI